MSTATLPAVNNGPAGPSTISARIDHNAVLKAVGLNLNDPNAQALLLTCERYGLDPILKHMVLIQGRPYVTRDGLLHVAHRSGQFDGIEVIDQGETPSHHTAKVSVYRKDMGRPFTYIGRYPKNGGNRNYGPEMAVKCGEVMALRRAFNVALCAREEIWDQEIGHDVAPGADQYRAIEHDDRRREVNESFARERQPVPSEPEPDAMPEKTKQTWAAYVAKVCTEKRDHWHNELAISNVPQGDRVRSEFQMPDQHQVLNHFVSHAITTGAIKPEDVSKDGTPDGARDPSKAKSVMAELFRRAPKRVMAAVEGYFGEKERELRVRLGMDDMDDTDGPETEAVQTQGREPGCDDDR